MDEEIDVQKKNVDENLKEAVDSELTSFINPKTAPNQNTKIAHEMLEQKIDFGIQNALKPKTPQTEATPIKEPQAQAPKQKPVQTAEVSSRPIIRTYKSDMEETIQAGHLSSINMAVSENNKLMQQIKPGSLETKKSSVNRNIIIISLILVAGGALAIFIPYVLVQKQNAPQTVATSTVSSQSVMTTDIEEKINLNQINLNGIDVTLNERVNQSSTELGQVKDFLLTEGSGANEAPITSTEFLTLLKANVPDEISRSLLPQYMFGMYNYDGNQEFLILKINSYDTAFSGMLSWEPDLWNDFQNLFGLSNTGASSTSSSTSIGIIVKKFQDAEFDNKDCRVIKDDSGNIIFLYSIIDPNTIVITTSPDTLKEIISRITQVSTVTQ